MRKLLITLVLSAVAAVGCADTTMQKACLKDGGVFIDSDPPGDFADGLACLDPKDPKTKDLIEAMYGDDNDR